MNFKELAQKYHDRIITYRRDFHSEPEVSFHEFKTSEKIKKFLTDNGIEILPIVSDTSVVGIIRGGKPGKTFGLRADIDALPMPEKNDLPYKSKHEGVMHSCGHDAHTAMLMGVALVMNEVKDELEGNLKLIFQAAEEKTPGGAIGLVNAGVLENPTVDAIMAFHVNTTLPAGVVGFKPNASSASADKFTITVIGVGGHGAHPDKTIDPIAISGQIITSLQQIVSRSISGVQSGVVTIGTIHGGTKDNIIADEVVMTGTIRTLDKNIRTFIHKRIDEILRGIEISFNCKCKLELELGYPVLYNNAEFIRDYAVGSTAKIVGAENVIELPVPSMGAEDMAYYLEKVPGVIGSLGAGNVAKGITVGGHNSLFNIDEDCLWVGTACLAQTAWDYLSAK